MLCGAGPHTLISGSLRAQGAGTTHGSSNFECWSRPGVTRPDVTAAKCGFNYTQHLLPLERFLCDQSPGGFSLAGAQPRAQGRVLNAISLQIPLIIAPILPNTTIEAGPQSRPSSAGLMILHVANYDYTNHVVRSRLCSLPAAWYRSVGKRSGISRTMFIISSSFAGTMAPSYATAYALFIFAA